MEFPAAADFAVTGALMEAAAGLGKKAHAGVVHCKDSFYGQHSPETSPVAARLREQWEAWRRGGCLASEMESAALFILAAARGLRAGCVLEVLWNQEAAGLENPRAAGTGDAIDTAAAALALLIAADRKRGEARG
mgnify:CR=1 FL=1